MGIFTRLGKRKEDEEKEKKKSGMGQLLVGAAKGLGSTVSTIGEMGDAVLSKTIGKGVEAITGKKGVGTSVKERGGAEKALGNLGVENAFTPTNTAQKIGFAGEQIGEFFVPGGAVAKSAKAAELAASAGKFAKYAPKIGKAVGIAGEALASGGTSLAQTGDLKEAGTSALLGGAFAGVGGVAKQLSGVASKYLKEKVAPRMINSLVKPLSKEFEFGRNAGAGVIREGIKANTKGGLLTKITAKKDELGKLIGSKLSGVKTKVNIEPAIAKIDEFIAKADSRGERELGNRLLDIKEGLTSTFTREGRNLVASGKKAMQITPEEARLIKTELGDATRWTGQTFDNDINQARVAVYRELNKIIDDAVPGVKELNARYADILSAERSMKRTIDIAERSNMVGLIPSGVGSAVGVGTTLATGAISPASVLSGAVAGALATGATKALGSTAAKTRLGVPLVKGVANSVEGLTSLAAKNGIPISGTLAKFLDALSKEEVATEAQAATEEAPVEDVTAQLKNTFPAEYHPFIEAALKDNHSPEEIAQFIQSKTNPQK